VFEVAILETLLKLAVIASWVYWLIALLWVREHFAAPHEPGRDFTPPVSVLKPVRGVDAQTYQNFASFCRQDYPVYELLFGVDDPDDPAALLVRRLQQEFPRVSIRLIVAPMVGMNRKASILHALAGNARHQVLVANDADMRVTPDYLRRVTSPLADPQTGLVTCPYRGESPVTFTARLEALYIGVTFLPSVLVGRRVLNMRFAMGATVALRATDLARMGGFAAVADYLADDYQIGARIAALGLRVHLSDYIVSTILGATTFREQWDREVRWAHCNRVSRPWEYPGLLLTFSTPFAALLAVATGFDRPAQWLLMVSLLLRWAVAWLITRYTDNRAIRPWLVWLPVRDMLTALIWCAGAVGREVVWRGDRFLLRDDGRLQPFPTKPRRFPAREV